MWRRASICFLIATLVGVCPSRADDDAKHGKPHERGEARGTAVSVRFADRDRVILHDYYVG